MSQLIFQPSLDPFHAMFRFIRLRGLLNVANKLSRDHARILDFYLLFPFRIRAIRLAPRHQKFKKLSDKYQSLKPYGELPDDPLMFQRMEPMQSAALETLASKAFFDLQALKHGAVESTEQKLPDEIEARIFSLNGEQSDLLDFLSVLATDYNPLGERGLKARTGLLEYRYDAV
jgi:hypothetical protein